MLGRPALAGQARPHQTSAAPTQILPCLGQTTVASLEISGLSEESQAGLQLSCAWGAVNSKAGCYSVTQDQGCGEWLH